ncbi:MAG TPA: hypothetical protein DCW68_03980 [Rhodospirillaceae bacterium]|nr:hypothetical protein [Rhodospirillaceae bacterium]
MNPQPKPELPKGCQRLLLHVCCAPCSGAIIRDLKEAGIEFAVAFCNPNIQPRAEYERRKAALLPYLEKHSIPFVLMEGDEDEWTLRTKGLEAEPERGARCTICFTMRFEIVADYAAAHGFDCFATTLSLSRYKSREQIIACAEAVAKKHPPLRYWLHDFRKGGGQQNADAVAREEGFYRQNYCGCIHSIRKPAEK